MSATTLQDMGEDLCRASPTSSVSSIMSSTSKSIEAMDESLALRRSNTPKDGSSSVIEGNFSLHEKFYYADGSVEFLVENVVYKVHRSLFERQSAWFRERMQCTADDLLPGWKCHRGPLGDQFFVNHTLGEVSFSPPRIVEGPDGRIRLEDITVPAFNSFLSILYPEDYNNYDLTSQSEWADVLRLASRWSFHSIRSLAIRRLESFLPDSPLDRLVLARACNVPQWVTLALEDLSMRNEPLRESEMLRMECRDVAIVAEIRESDDQYLVRPAIRENIRNIQRRKEKTAGAVAAVEEWQELENVGDAQEQREVDGSSNVGSSCFDLKKELNSEAAITDGTWGPGALQEKVGREERRVEREAEEARKAEEARVEEEKRAEAEQLARENAEREAEAEKARLAKVAEFVRRNAAQQKARTQEAVARLSKLDEEAAAARTKAPSLISDLASDYRITLNSDGSSSRPNAQRAGSTLISNAPATKHTPPSQTAPLPSSPARPQQTPTQGKGGLWDRLSTVVATALEDAQAARVAEERRVEEGRMAERKSEAEARKA
ncbi:hypothetical protein K488DRAFT_87883 [Vararia minispora EC-137]|uniref:Uncharacterized protein n=1 Tax=Vararia minispora EC-137 TaxID=1314806 RepID=A0ACB8QER7_9AGAM|nr:hypothetical protein K488DRAFT_87883 [Vararia minispora EC-137]